jgi:hypothetical protein
VPLSGNNATAIAAGPALSEAGMPLGVGIGAGVIVEVGPPMLQPARANAVRMASPSRVGSDKEGRWMPDAGYLLVY